MEGLTIVPREAAAIAIGQTFVECQGPDMAVTAEVD